tara:strand:+ start:410 stop:1387 length:978 start_codon:yes stop_codon:yes gene_type:complete
MQVRKMGMLLSAALILATAVVVDAAEGKLKGYMFGDYYAVLAADDGEVKSPEKRNAFQFRRIYLTYDKALNDEFSVRYRLETKDAGFGKGAKMQPFVKHGYLKWKGAFGASDFYFGLQGTPTWAIAEKVWGYRSISKTILDRNKIGSSADIGAALKGKAGKIGYHVMLGNGPGQGPEDDHGKKIYGSLSVKASDRLVFEGYADFNMKPAAQNELTVKVFAGLQSEGLDAGLEVFSRTNAKAAAGEDVTISGLSAFASLPLGVSLKGFGRVDAISNDSKDTTDLLVIAGLDHMPAKNVHLMPNVVVALPDGSDPHIQARLTFYYTF